MEELSEQCGKLCWKWRGSNTRRGQTPASDNELTRKFEFVPEAVRRQALEVAKWQQRYRVDWDSTDGRNGGAQKKGEKY